METVFYVYVRVDSQIDNTMPSEVLSIIKDRHHNFIYHGIVEGYWRGFAEETMAFVIRSREELVADTVEEIKAVLQYEYAMFDTNNGEEINM